MGTKANVAVIASAPTERRLQFPQKPRLQRQLQRPLPREASGISSEERTVESLWTFKYLLAPDLRLPTGAIERPTVVGLVSTIQCAATPDARSIVAQGSWLENDDKGGVEGSALTKACAGPTRDRYVFSPYATSRLEILANLFALELRGIPNLVVAGGDQTDV
jgi:hypothetical protein